MDKHDEYLEANKRSWDSLAADHHEHFKALLEKQESTVMQPQLDELGDLQGKRLIHLQCNTGADTVSLARRGAMVTGVDLAPENIRYARELAAHFGIADARFIESDVLELIDRHDEKYDVVYTSEGALCWLPDLDRWARVVRHLMKDDGFLYVLDLHPFYMAWDEDKLPELVVKYPYFEKRVDRDEWIGGYAAERRQATNYTWGYTVGELVNALGAAGLHIEWLHEFDWLFFELSADRQRRERGRKWVYPEHEGKLPFSFSLKATVR